MKERTPELQKAIEEYSLSLAEYYGTTQTEREIAYHYFLRLSTELDEYEPLWRAVAKKNQKIFNVDQDYKEVFPDLFLENPVFIAKKVEADVDRLYNKWIGLIQYTYMKAFHDPEGAEAFLGLVDPSLDVKKSALMESVLSDGENMSVFLAFHSRKKSIVDEAKYLIMGENIGSVRAALASLERNKSRFHEYEDYLTRFCGIYIYERYKVYNIFPQQKRKDENAQDEEDTDELKNGQITRVRFNTLYVSSVSKRFRDLTKSSGLVKERALLQRVRRYVAEAKEAGMRTEVEIQKYVAEHHAGMKLSHADIYEASLEKVTVVSIDTSVGEDEDGNVLGDFLSYESMPGTNNEMRSVEDLVIDGEDNSEEELVEHWKGHIYGDQYDMMLVIYYVVKVFQVENNLTDVELQRLIGTKSRSTVYKARCVEKYMEQTGAKRKYSTLLYNDTLEQMHRLAQERQYSYRRRSGVIPGEVGIYFESSQSLEELRSGVDFDNLEIDEEKVFGSSKVDGFSSEYNEINFN